MSHSGLLCFTASSFLVVGCFRGRLRGTQTEVKLEHGTETVQGMLTYQLGGGDSILIGGLSEC